MIRLAAFISFLNLTVGCGQENPTTTSDTMISLVKEDSVPLSPVLKDLLTEIDNSNLKELKTTDQIPTFIRTYIESYAKGFTIANKGENWQETDLVQDAYVTRKEYDAKTGDTILIATVDTTRILPDRELIYFGLGENIALMAYYSGGFGKCEHVAIFRFANSEVTQMWHQYIPCDLETPTSITEFLKLNTKRQWALNTGYL